MKSKFLKIEGKGFEKSNYIKRFFHLLNIIAPNKYELNTWNADASIESIESQMTVLTFTGNIL